MNYEVVIGLEVHVQLNTKSKIFCGCPNKFGAKPNTQTCPICQGHPGVLPVLNKEVLLKAIQAGLALNCSINYFSKFDRKNYFYPDLPKAYQISQYDLPICKSGYVEIQLDNGTAKEVAINRIHMEEDAGKLIHSEITNVLESYIDVNRCGVPLLEIVTEPDMRSSEEAYHYLQTLKSILRYINVSDCNMEEGSLRGDANISLRPKGETKLGTKAEVKNLNSFKSVQKALEYEIRRQSRLLDRGEKIIQETLLYNADQDKTFSMRSKEEAHDYRYFPDPDLVPISLDEAFIENIRKGLPELPKAKQRRFIEKYQLSERDSKILISSVELANFFETALAAYPKSPKKVANWIMGELLKTLNDKGIDISDVKISPQEVGILVGKIEEGEITAKIGKKIFEELFNTGKTVDTLIEDLGFKVMSDTSELSAIIDQVIAEHPDTVATYKSGKEQAFGFLVGQIMKTTKGQANPKTINELLKKKLTS